MKEIIKKIIDKFLCMHSYKMIHEIRVRDDWGSTWRVFHYQCTKCGENKKIKSN